MKGSGVGGSRLSSSPRSSSEGEREEGDGTEEEETVWRGGRLERREGWGRKGGRGAAGVNERGRV